MKEAGWMSVSDVSDECAWLGLEVRGEVGRDQRPAVISGRARGAARSAGRGDFWGVQWHVPDTMTARWAMDGELVIVGAGALAATAEDVKKGFGLRSKVWLIGSGSERRALA